MPQLSTCPLSQSEAIQAGSTSVSMSRTLRRISIVIGSVCQRAFSARRFRADFIPQVGTMPARMLETETGDSSVSEILFRGGRQLGLLFIILALSLNTGVAHAQPDPPSRPILFVHGWCGTAFDWAPFFSPSNPYRLSAYLPAGLYTNQDVYFVEYDRKANTIGFTKVDHLELGSKATQTDVGVAVPPDARFFVINFIDPDPSSPNPENTLNVARSSVLNKAYEISAVVKYIKKLTNSQDVNIMAHSMGGLDARAYIENMASVGDCYSYGSIPQDSVPNYEAGTCQPGQGKAEYTNDVANIVMLDTPNNGSTLTFEGLRYLEIIDSGCMALNSTNSNEITLASDLLETLNYSGSSLAGKLPQEINTPIQAIENYDSEITSSWTQLSGLSDDIVLKSSQSIKLNVPDHNVSSYVSLQDIEIPYPSATIDATSGCNVWPLWIKEPMIHQLSCLGTLSLTPYKVAHQLIDDTVPWISSLSLTPLTPSLGDSVTLHYDATDLSSSTLSSAELWRAPDVNGKPEQVGWAKLV